MAETFKIVLFSKLSTKLAVSSFLESFETQTGKLDTNLETLVISASGSSSCSAVLVEKDHQLQADSELQVFVSFH